MLTFPHLSKQPSLAWPAVAAAAEGNSSKPTSASCTTIPSEHMPSFFFTMTFGCGELPTGVGPFIDEIYDWDLGGKTESNGPCELWYTKFLSSIDLMVVSSQKETEARAESHQLTYTHTLRIPLNQIARSQSFTWPTSNFLENFGCMIYGPIINKAFMSSRTSSSYKIIFYHISKMIYEFFFLLLYICICANYYYPMENKKIKKIFWSLVPLSN